MGLRTLNKAKTRQRISDVATRMFIEQGYEKVSIAEIAAAAEVSEKTIFNYFSKKETLVFDVEEEFERGMLEAIGQKNANEPTLVALYRYFQATEVISGSSKKQVVAFMNLVKNTPDLTNYWRNVYARYEKALAKEIRSEDGCSQMEAECLARLVLESVSFASTSSSPKKALKVAFDVLKKGWG